MRFKIFTFILGLCVLLHESKVFSQSIEPEISRKLSDYIQDKKAELSGKAKINLLLERVSDSSPVFETGADEFIHMASVQKLLISYVALKVLGAEHTFSTEVYSNWVVQDQKNSFNDGIAEGRGQSNQIKQKVELYLRPYGDPLFQYEDLLKIARELQSRKYDTIDKIIIDKSLFYNPIEVSGPDSYQAAQTSPAIEFNSFKVEVFPSVSGSPARIITSPGFYGEVINKVKTLSFNGANIDVSLSPDHQIFMGKGFQKRGQWKPTKFKLLIDGKIGYKDQIFVKYFSHPEPDSLYINSLKQAFTRYGIKIGDEILFDVVPQDAKLVYEHNSETLSVILNKLNHHSNNFIAGQLLFAIGQDQNGIFSAEKGLEVLLKTLKEIEGFGDKGNFVDASGLNKENRVSPKQILSVLKAAYKDTSVMPVFMSSLSRFGQSGSLINRDLLKSKDEYNVRTSLFVDQEQRASSVWSKPGFVDGVNSLAGYVETSGHQLLGYSLTVSGDIKKNEASDIMDDIIRIVLGIKTKSQLNNI